MKKKTVKSKDIFLFEDKGEFYKFHLGADVKPWRDESVKEGDWVETDSGGITTCLKIGDLRGHRSITTICGTYVLNSNTKMDNTIRSRYTSLVRQDGRTDSPITRKDRKFARLTMLGEDEVEAYKKLNPNAKSEGYIKEKIRIITKKQGYSEMVSEEFAKILAKMGVTKEWGISNLKGIAEDKGAPAGVRKEIIDDLIGDLGENRSQQTKLITEHSWHASSQIGAGELAEVKRIGEKTRTETPILEDKIEKNKI